MNNIEKEPISLMAELINMYSHILKDEMCRRNYRLSYHHLLKPLYEKDNVTQLDLVKSSDLKAPTVSYSLQQMEGDGLTSPMRAEKSNTKFRPWKSIFALLFLKE